MRSAVKHNGIPLLLEWQSRKIKQRPLILIADISGSMEKYSRLILQLFLQRHAQRAERRMFRIWHAIDAHHPTTETQKYRSGGG